MSLRVLEGVLGRQSGVQSLLGVGLAVWACWLVGGFGLALRGVLLDRWLADLRACQRRLWQSGRPLRPPLWAIEVVVGVVGS